MAPKCVYWVSVVCCAWGLYQRTSGWTVVERFLGLLSVCGVHARVSARGNHVVLVT